ncbi:MAG: glycosyltransferase [Alphaproteobacteria bacterium]|nr:glycosyltransferase [Alphaproteobacteria bacterium]
MVASGEQKGAILVLGMHRSGTSALTRGLEVLGVSLGDNLKEPAAGDNEKGFFEDWALSLINDELLALNGGRWDSLFAHSPGSDANGATNALKLKAIDAIQKQFGDARYFAFKDPRSCRTVPFWKDVLAKQGLPAFYVIAFRNPISVARSLEQRDGFARTRSYYLWLLHMLSAARDTQGEARVFVEYDELLSDPAAVLNKIADMVADPMIAVSPDKLRKYAREFLDADLRHHVDRPSHLELDNACPPAAKAVYALLRAESGGETPAEDLDAAWTRCFESFDQIAPYSLLMDTLDREARAMRADLERRLFDLNNAHTSLVNEFKDLGVLFEQSRADLASSRARATELASQVDASSAQIVEQNRKSAALSAEILALSSELNTRSAAFDEARNEAAAALDELRAVLEQERHEGAEAFKRAAAEFEKDRADIIQALQRVQALAAAEGAQALEHAQALRKALVDGRILEERIVHLEEDLSAAREGHSQELARVHEEHAERLADVRDEQAQILADVCAGYIEELSRADDEHVQARAQTEARYELSITSALADAEARHERSLAGALADAESRYELGMAGALADAEAQYRALMLAHDSLLERLRAVYASTSWRVAAPLRAIKSTVSASSVNEAVPGPAPAFRSPEIAAGPHASAPAAREPQNIRRVHFTICAKNYLPIARTCLLTSAAMHPDTEHYLVLCDEVDQDYDPSSEPFAVIAVRDVAIPCFEDMALRYDVMEFNTAVKPFCFQHFFAAGADEVVYLDPDLYFLSPLEEVRSAFRNGAEAVATPHITSPIDDDKNPGDVDMLRAGTYNLGFLALRRRPDAERFAGWWAERLRTGAVSDIQRGLFTDQKWCDLLPSFVGRTHILRHPGYNLAYWNLMHRPVAKHDGRWTAAGRPISFVHFSGASFQDANVFSKHQDRYDASSIGALRELYDQYRNEVRANGMGTGPSYRYSFDFDAKGNRIPGVLRALYRDEVAPAPAEIVDIGALIARANERAADVPLFHDVAITRVMHRIWKSRPDLQAAFDLNSENGQRGFVDWCAHSFAREYALDERFYPAASSQSGREPPPESTAPASLAMVSRSILANATSLRPLYRHLPANLRQRARVALTRAAYSNARQATSKNGTQGNPGAALVGYARGELGMGEHVRMTAVSMEAEGVPMGIVNISENLLARQEDRRFDHLHSEQADFRANIFHVNADQLPVVTASLGDRFLSGKCNIAYPFWELGQFPDDWMPQLNAMDELWAPTRFIQEALAIAQRPVVHMPVAVELAPGYEKWRREDFDLPNDAFVFLFYFDLASFSSRKNPVGVLEAFKLGLTFVGARLPREVRLVVKVISADRFPSEFAHLQEMTRSVPGVVLMPDVFSADKIHGLVNCADAFVSLHRSEGFGRGPAEAMRLGKVAIATGYSGNMDYMNEANSFPVPFHLRPVGEGEYPYGAGQHWADPDIREAATIMARLMGEPSLSREVGARARAYMIEHHAKDVIGRRYADRLRAIGALN